MFKQLARRFMDPENPEGLSFRFRVRRIQRLLPIIQNAHRTNGEVNILDVGGIKPYWNILPDELLSSSRVRITILNPEFHSNDLVEGRFTSVQGDGCDLSRFEDNAFHVVHSNSVIEHVGNYERRQCFAREIQRVGQAYFVQTPYFWFPIEPHAFFPVLHWLPYRFRLALVRRFSLGHFERQTSLEDAEHLLDTNRILKPGEFKRLFAGAQIIRERFLGLTKSLVAISQPDSNPGG